MRKLINRREALFGLAVIVGLGAGFGAVGFHYLIGWFTYLFTGYADYSAVGRVPNPHIPGLGVWFLVLVPVIAGLLYGPLVSYFAPEARGHGVPEVMYAVAREGGRIRPQVAIVKSLASALCIGGGGSVGREGPIVQIGSALGSSLAQVTGLDDRKIRLLVGCGAAGGIAATFNAPLAGAFFATEVILGIWSAETLALMALASVSASTVGQAFLGSKPFLDMPALHISTVWAMVLFAVLGLLSGVTGVTFSRVLYWIEDGCDWLWRGPEALRPAVGGLFLGLLLLALPEMYGVGYPVLGNAVAGKYAIGFLLLLLVGKIFATSLTIGIGGSGGVFAPSLFIGSMLGAAFGQTLGLIDPSLAGASGTWAVVGMGAVFAGATQAPATGIVILFELTGEYSLILPMMLAIALATMASRAVSKDTIYTRKLLRRGIDISVSQPDASRA